MNADEEARNMTRGGKSLRSILAGQNPIDPGKFMVEELIAALAKLDPKLYVCGNAGDESCCLFSGISETREADQWHDSLPSGSKFISLSFEGVIPHERGEGVFKQSVPAPPPPAILYKCPDCQGEKLTTKGQPSCRVCSWRPMMKPVTALGRESDGNASPDSQGR